MSTSFYQFYNQINGQPYTDGVPPPAEYDLADYGISDTGGADLTPLTDDDMKTTSRDDAMAWYLKHGKNTTKLGEPLDDEGMKKYTGLG